MADIEFHCSSCGSKLFKKPENPQPDDMIACSGCGAAGRYADIHASAVKQAKQAVEKHLRDALKKAGLK